LQTLGENICPAVIAVRCSAVPVGDRIAKNYNSGRIKRRGNIDARNEVPLVDGFRPGKLRRQREVPMYEIRSGPRAGVSSLPVDDLSICSVMVTSESALA
jgi:hypothetical protein